MGIFGKPPDSKPDGTPAAQATAAAPPTAPAASAARGTCVIGPKTIIKGEVLGDEDVLVQGTVEGAVRIACDLYIAPGGTVKATIEAKTVVVSGEVVGDCIASGRVELQATGRLLGNIRAPRIVIIEGAVFKGMSDMSGRKDERKEKAAAS